MMTTLLDLDQRRPARADARRNYDALVHAARTAFAELGARAPLEEIARRADVGIATLYRNFPTREDLIESVYLVELDSVCRAAETFGQLGPWDAFIAWIERLVDYLGTKRALIEGLNQQSSAYQLSREALTIAGEPLLKRAQDHAVARPDVTIYEVLWLVWGISGVNFEDDALRDKVLRLGFDGLRAQFVPAEA
ncbi:TetR family transcriptional regulator [Devosia epidermidihirudinis]|uniref:TetR family transcriptional regulator n=1 Tax=Devosia epidermidihirudinis TaxID=1293439 RepID=A0A0F5Q4L5_9HYPH|nr:helix-turn-helix domain-containing protein [Devosia epidermidihirudinis]KKC35873.1 TetR family transcriptional regulator [Devosia epidermidihirudinis]